MKRTISIKKNHEFLYVYRKGLCYVGKFMVFHTLSRSDETLRFGVSASKKVGNSVVRNRLRRLVRASYMEIESKLMPGREYVFVLRATPTLPDFKHIRKEMLFLCKKLNVLVESEITHYD